MSQALPIQAPSPAAQERIQHIIEASSTVMARQGYANTSMKDIAREAGIAQGLIHYYFGSKEDLVLAVLRDACAEMLAETRSSFAEAPGPPLVKAWAALQAAQRRSIERPELFRLMFEMIPLAINNGALRLQLQDLYGSLCDEVTSMTEELSEQLPAPLPIPVRDLAAVIIAGMDGLALRSLVEPGVDQAALFRALGFVLLSFMTSSYALAGLPLPPAGQVAELLGIPPQDGSGDDGARP